MSLRAACTEETKALMWDERVEMVARRVVLVVVSGLVAEVMVAVVQTTFYKLGITYC